MARPCGWEMIKRVLMPRETVVGVLHGFKRVPGACLAAIGEHTVVLDEGLADFIGDLVGREVAAARWDGRDRIIPWSGWS